MAMPQKRKDQGKRMVEALVKVGDDVGADGYL